MRGTEAPRRVARHNFRPDPLSALRIAAHVALDATFGELQLRPTIGARARVLIRIVDDVERELLTAMGLPYLANRGAVAVSA